MHFPFLLIILENIPGKVKSRMKNGAKGSNPDKPES